MAFLNMCQRCLCWICNVQPRLKILQKWLRFLWKKLSLWSYGL